jgi:hypothetical protein
MADPRSVRLIFQYDGDRIDLVSRQQVDMMTPSSGPLSDFSDRLGTWVEVRDAEGAALHRQVLPDPVRTSAEVFSPDPDESLRRVERTRRTGAFTVVVPDLPQADHVALVSAGAASAPTPGVEGGERGPAEAGARPEPRVLRFPLHDDASEPGGRS